MEERIERIAHRAARCCRTAHLSWEETVQEGRILAYQTLTYKPDASDAYLFSAVVRSLGMVAAVAGLPFRVDPHDWRIACGLRKRILDCTDQTPPRHGEKEVSWEKGLRGILITPPQLRADTDPEQEVSREQVRRKAAQRIAELLANDDEGHLTLEMLRMGAGLTDAAKAAGTDPRTARTVQKRVLRRLAKDDVLRTLADDLPV